MGTDHVIIEYRLFSVTLIKICCDAVAAVVFERSVMNMQSENFSAATAATAKTAIN